MRKLVAAALVVLFALGFGAEVIGRGIVETAFSPAPYVEALRQTDLADTVAQMLRERLADEVLAQEGVSAILTQEDLDAIAAKLITPAWVTAQAESALRGLSRWFASSDAEPRVTVSLADLKPQILPLLAQQLVERAKQLPPCDAAAVQDAIAAILQHGQIPLCWPPGLNVEEAVTAAFAIFSGPLHAAIDRVPDEVDVFQLLREQNPEQVQQVVQQLDTIREARDRANAALNLLLGALLVLFSGVGLLASRPARSVLQWWGASLLAGSGFSLLAFGFGRVLLNASLNWMLSGVEAEVAAYGSRVAETVFAALAKGVQDWVMWAAAATAGVGIALLLVSLAFPRKSRKETTGTGP